MAKTPNACLLFITIELGKIYCILEYRFYYQTADCSLAMLSITLQNLGFLSVELIVELI